MKEVKVTVPVWVLEESDVAEVTEDARVSGGLQSVADAIAASLPVTGLTVQVAMSSDNRGRMVRKVNIAGNSLAVGDGMAFHPALPMTRVDAVLLADASPTMRTTSPPKKAAKKAKK